MGEWSMKQNGQFFLGRWTLLVAPVFVFFFLVDMVYGQNRRDQFEPRPNPRLDQQGFDRDRYKLLGPNMVFGKPNEVARYHLLDDHHLQYLREHRELVDRYGNDLFLRIERLKWLDAYAQYDSKVLEILWKATFRGPIPVGVTMLEFLKLSIDQFMKLTDEQRVREFCRYRIHLYRIDGIMYPPDCIRR
jgi:hypothetical protein